MKTRVRKSRVGERSMVSRTTEGFRVYENEMALCSNCKENLLYLLLLVFNASNISYAEGILAVTGESWELFRKR